MIDDAMKNWGADHARLKPLLEDLAAAYCMSGRLAEGDDALRQTAEGPKQVEQDRLDHDLVQLTGVEALPSLKPDYLAGYLQGQAQAFAGMGRNTDAESSFKHALAIREGASPPDKAKVDESLRALAAFYRTTNRKKNAEILEKRLFR